MEIHGGPEKRRRRKSVDSEWLKFMSDDEKEVARIQHLQTTSLADVGLPVRIVNTLENQGVFTVGELTQVTASRLHGIQNLGAITIQRCTRLMNELRLPNRLHEYE